MTLCWQNPQFFAASTARCSLKSSSLLAVECGSFSGSVPAGAISLTRDEYPIDLRPASEPLFAEAEKGGRPDSGTAAASDLKPSVGAA